MFCNFGNFSVNAARLVAGAVLWQCLTSQAFALDRTWIGGNVDWVDGGANTNWNPNDEPDSDDRAIFNTANSVNLGSNNAVNGLALSAGIDLFTNEFELTVDGLVEVGGAGTNLFLGDSGGSVDADDVVINASGTIELRGGTLTMDEEVGAALIDINAGGNLIGNGTISFADTPLIFTTVLINDGELTVLSRGLTIFSPPPVGTLQINTSGSSFYRVDLDGATEAGVVNVNRNQTIDLNVGFADAFNGTMNLFQDSHFNSLNAWTLAGGSIVANNGFVDNSLPTPDIPAGTSFIEGGLLTQTGGTIDVPDNDGTLHLDAAFTMSGGTFTNFGTVIFDGNTNITTAAGYEPSALTSQTIINAPMVVNEPGANFNWDGPGAASTTINGSSSLSLVVDQIDTTDDVFGGTLTLNDNADLSVSIVGTSWTSAGTINKNGAGFSTITGTRMMVTGAVNANAGTLDTGAVTTTASAAITVTGTMTFGGASELGGGTITGAGHIEMEGTSTVTANTTIGVSSFDWDGLGTGTTHTINALSIFTINSTTFDSDGDMDDPITLAGSGSQLIVNGPTHWTATAAINGNNAGVGTATIGGTSRLILTGVNADFNVNGDTDVTAPLTFGASSSASIDAGFTLDAQNNVTYSGGTISGAGTYSPGSTNTVTADSTINVSNFDLDGGNWTIEGALLTLNVTDYDPGVAVNAFDTAITINSGDIFVTSGDASFVMDGTLNMNSTTVGLVTEWNGEPIDIGNDASALDATVNVAGGEISRLASQVTFNSDANVDVAAGSELQIGGAANFNSVNGLNVAEFTGAGDLLFNGVVNVNEATTLNMVGGLVDLDGADAIGDLINIDAPLTINAVTMSNFGRVNGAGGINTLDINNSVGTGVLTVNLDDPDDTWTLNSPGVMNLVNDNTAATLLAGNAVNVNGIVNVTGDVTTSSALHIAGVVNINTAGEQLTLNGFQVVSTISGGTINGPGRIAASAGRSLRGFGTINADIDFNGSSFLHAENGILTITGAILDVQSINATGDAAVLNVVNPWDSGVAGSVGLSGGTIQGGTLTNNAASGIAGRGTLTSRVINNTVISASSGILVAQTAGNDNDWDGAGAGELRAINAGTLELRDVGAAFGFTGKVSAADNSRVFANGFALDFNPGSTIDLAQSTYESTNSTDIGGTVTVSAGAESRIKVANNNFLTFEAGSTSTLNGNLRLENNNIIVEQGATFVNGGGALVIPDGSHMVGENLADIDVLLQMDGAFRPGNSEAIGRVDLFEYQQGDSGELYVELRGTALNNFDRLVASGDVVLDGYLNIDLDGGFLPVLGQTFNIITGNTVTGTFDYADVSPDMPAGLAFHIEYLANVVQLQVVNKPIFSADFDNDGDVDPTDLAIWQGAYNLNQSGDADGDNDSDGRDFLLWQQQFGSAPIVAVTTAVPEPTFGGVICLLPVLRLLIRAKNIAFFGPRD